MSVSTTAKAIRSIGINWVWYQIEDTGDAVCFRLHKGEEELAKLEEDFKGRIEDGEMRPVRWEMFPRWGLRGKFLWLWERYNLCRDCVTTAIPKGKPMRKPRKRTALEEKYERDKARSVIKAIGEEKVREILSGRRWILLNGRIPVAHVTDEEKEIIDSEIIKKFGGMPEHLKWRKIELE